jgi:hypothetical protein
MESLIWSKSESKWAYILMLRDHEVYRLKVTGSMVTLGRNLRGVLEALQQGKAPAEAGAKSVEALDARSIARAEVSPENTSLTLHGGEGGSTTISYTTGDGDAGAILESILAKTDRTFRPTQEEIGVVEAVVPPGIVGLIGGLLWAVVYDSARKLAAGETVEAHGRRAGMQQMLIGAAEMLGENGTLAAGAGLLALVLGWAVLRVVRRPERTVWLPDQA